jgi:hypothetical protein
MKKSSYLIILIGIVLTVQSCLPSKKKAENTVFKNGNAWIPADFQPKKTVLLVQLLDENSVAASWRKKFRQWNEEMEAYMQEKYPYKYEFVTADQIEGSPQKYSDKTKYAFGLLVSNGTISYQGVGSSSPGNNTTKAVYDYYFIDRATGKKYPPTKKYSSNPLITFMPVVNTILDGR